MSNAAPRPPLPGSPPPRALRVLAWSAPLWWLGAVALGFWILVARPGALVGGLLVGFACVPVAWVLVSALWPARADRRCPACGNNALERLDARTTQGLRCRACGWRDESASAWLLAEEEGPLEELVLAQRRPPAGAGAVDSSAPRD